MAVLNQCDIASALNGNRAGVTYIVRPLAALEMNRIPKCDRYLGDRYYVGPPTRNRHCKLSSLELRCLATML